MTVSNFEWTDKTSIKWFIMLSSGHEGPYSYDALLAKLNKSLISRNIKVWAEGLGNTLTLEELIAKVEGTSESLEALDEIPPPIPGFMSDEPQNLAAFENEQPAEIVVPKKPSKLYPLLGVLFAFGVLGALTYQWFSEQGTFSIRRYPKMSVELHRDILQSFKFEGWDKKLFFREYVPADLSHIWLVTSGYQACRVEATFTSEKGKLISMGDEIISFKTSGDLRDHVVEFNHFNFSQGSKILPGLYEMELKADQCQWDSLLSKIGNRFLGPDQTYEARMKVILFAKGPAEFNRVLDELLKKKLEIETKKVSQTEMFWQDLQQKYQTLLAISLQIEQLMIDFMEKEPNDFRPRLKSLVEEYTKKFGPFLTNFVISNESYFKELSQGELQGLALSKNFEENVRNSSKAVGLLSMEIIEDLQKRKNSPSKAELASLKESTIKSFSMLKERINQRLIEVTEDRSK